MPRRIRLHVENAFYHVMARGNRKQQVFHEEQDYKTYLKLMEKYSQRYGVEVHGYALMPNHVHMLLRMSTLPLSKFMQGLQQTYTQYYNKKNETVGHVFQGRYKSLYVDRDEYLLQLIRYIHLNPVKDGFVADPTQYRWTSHKCYFRREPGKELSKDLSEELSKKSNKDSSAEFNRELSFVQTYFIKDLLAAYGGTIIDDYQLVPDAIAHMMENENADNKEAEANQARRAQDVGQILIEPRLDSRHRRPALEAVAGAVGLEMGIESQAIMGTGRQPRAVAARRVLAYAACRLWGYRLQEVAAFLGCSEVHVSKSVKLIEDRLIGGDQATAAVIEGVRLKLT